MDTREPRILVVHRDKALGESLAQSIGGYLNAPGTCHVSGDDARQLQRKIGEARLDAVALCSSGCSYESVLRKALHVQPDIRALVFGLRNRRRDILAAIRAGAAACTTVDSSLDDLVESIAALCAGETVCSPRIAQILFSEVAAGNGSPASIPRDQTPRLTPRERQIIGLIELGLSNKQIANRLSIEVQTVKNHVHNILEKLRLHRRAEAARYAREHGLLCDAAGTGTSAER